MCIGSVGEEIGMVSIKLSIYSFLPLTDSLSERCVVKESRTTSSPVATVIPER